MLRQKKVAKEKATPGYAVGYANFPALLETGGGCGTRATPSDSPRPFSAAFSAARRFTRGSSKRLGFTQRSRYPEGVRVSFKYLGSLHSLTFFEGNPVKTEIDLNVIYLLLEALKVPHIALLFGMLGIGIIFVAYATATKNK